MAEQIVTLGIGGTPATLTPFITTGLEVGAAVVPAMPDHAAFMLFRDKRSFVRFRDKRAVVLRREKRATERGRE